MNKLAQTLDAVRQDVPLAHGEMLSRKPTGVYPVISEDLIHDLRQPLGVIDSLAYYLELTSADDRVCEHLQKIRAMVTQANRILERASLHSEIPMGSALLS